MKKLLLDGTWHLKCETAECDGTIPGSVYSFLLAAGKMEDPFYRDNELKALALMDQDFSFSRSFTVEKGFLDSCRRVILHCDGLDTLCTLFLNGREIGKAYNMHRIWEFDVTDAVREGENTISVEIESPTRWIAAEDEKDFVGCSYHAMKGCSHLRKPHCMFGWDWGPRLPDAGIWKSISLQGLDGARIEQVRIRQKHEDGRVSVTVDVRQDGCAQTEITITGPDGEVIRAENGIPAEIPEPKLWWPNGYGEQPLYTVKARLLENGREADCEEKRIGLRTMTVAREKDQWGESFAHCVNGMKIFAMGADYIPEDNIFSRITPERTRHLLEQCKAANFNAIRVWGGGHYPTDAFYDACDELGLIVWQDFMFACSNYHLTPEFEENIRAEFVDNVRRLRHHASLGLWCGNNEMEMFAEDLHYDGTLQTQRDYLIMFEYLIPKVLREEDPDTFYWPASPSSGGSFDEPNDPSRGDVHYWEVWHGSRPFEEYRKYFFRYVSEFGFQSFPCLKTVESYTAPEDRNIFSRVMDMHQRNEGANGKIMNYLSQTFLYPSDFDTLLYASQLLQADAIRYGVEHWRRYRGRCMGAIYWQLNDIWPVASWASIDYFGRWKALHYYAKRFFAPLALSCEEIGEMTDRFYVTQQATPIETSAHLCVANERPEERRGIVRWALRNASGEVLQSGEQEVTVPALSSVWLDKLDFHCTDFRENYISYSLEADGEPVSEGTALFTLPKYFQFRDPHLTWRREGSRLIVSADAYARGVEISSPDCDLLLSDNYFDLNADEKEVEILSGDPKEIKLRSVYQIR